AVPEPLAERAGIRLAVHVPDLLGDIHVSAATPGPPPVRQRPGPRPERGPDAEHGHVAGRPDDPPAGGPLRPPPFLAPRGPPVSSAANPRQLDGRRPRRVPAGRRAGAAELATEVRGREHPGPTWAQRLAGLSRRCGAACDRPDYCVARSPRRF